MLTNFRHPKLFGFPSSGGIIRPGSGGGGGPVEPIADTWRVFILSNYGGGWLIIPEIAMAESVSGTNLCPTAPTKFYNGLNGNLFDGNAGTYAGNTGYAYGQWAACTFASPVTIREVRVTSENSGNYYLEAPIAFVLQYSLDSGSTWFTAGTGNLHQWTVQGQTKSVPITPITFPSSGRGNARGWRVNCTVKGNGATTGYAGFQEMILAGSAGGANLANLGTSGVPFMNSVYGYNEGPRQLVDGNSTGTGSAFTRNTSNAPYMFAYMFNNPTDIYEVRIQAAANSGESNLAPGDFTIDYTTDFINWTTVRTVTGETGWTASEIRTFVL